MHVLLGVCFEIAATLVGTAGKQLVRFSSRHRRKAPRRAKLFKTVGLLTTTLLGPILDTSAYTFAPQSIVAPLNGFDIVWNICSAPCTLGEQLRNRHIFGTALIFWGATMSSVLGPHTHPAQSLETLQRTFLSTRFLAYAVIFAALLVGSAFVLVRRPAGSKARGLALGLVAGGIAGNMFFVSSGCGLLQTSAASGDWGAWGNWLPYAVLAGAGVVALTNIPLMAAGLEEYEALFMVTLFEGSHITVACVSGALILREMDDEAMWCKILYWCCIFVVVLGLMVVQTSIGPRLAEDIRSPLLIDKALHADAGQNGNILDDGHVVWASKLSGVARVCSSPYLVRPASAERMGHEVFKEERDRSG
mmetsp:Transcript_70823/g.196752  ORF Transcript_70823/g.196752 Transcript_70823/m.196752 type:complete len:362 (+) Transcript_70823:82-1167(+)